MVLNTFPNIYIKKFIVKCYAWFHFLEGCFYVCTPKQDKMLHLTAYTTHTHLSTIKDGHFQKVKSAQSFPVKNNTINQWSDISLLLCFIFYVHMSQFLCVLEFEPIISPQNLIA